MANILIVEDDARLQSVFKLIITRAGHEVATANDGHEALDVAESFKPDLILLDIMMPRKDGIEFLRDYHPAKNHPNVKIIIFSNAEKVENLDEAYKLGANRYILKSTATPKELTALVAQVLET